MVFIVTLINDTLFYNIVSFSVLLGIGAVQYVKH